MRPHPHESRGGLDSAMAGDHAHCISQFQDLATASKYSKTQGRILRAPCWGTIRGEEAKKTYIYIYNIYMYIYMYI